MPSAKSSQSRRCPRSRTFSVLKHPTPQFPDCQVTEQGRPTRRAKIHYCLDRSGLNNRALEDFIEVNINDLSVLFKDLNTGAHGPAADSPAATRGRCARTCPTMTTLVSSAMLGQAPPVCVTDVDGPYCGNVSMRWLTTFNPDHWRGRRSRDSLCAATERVSLRKSGECRPTRPARLRPAGHGAPPPPEGTTPPHGLRSLSLWHQSFLHPVNVTL